MKVLWGILIGIAALVVVVVLVAGYFGFVPGVSNLFGSNKPVNLGTTYTAQDYKSAIAKTGIQFVNGADTLSLSSSQKTYGPAKAVNVDLTPAEALAIMNDKVHAPDFPLKDFQLRLNNDGTAEISGLMMLDKLNNYATAHGGTDEGVQQALDTIKKTGVIEKEIPIYIKGEAAVVNGQLTFDATSLKVGRLPLSADLVNSHSADIIDYFNNHKNDIPGLKINNASLVNGKIHFDGTLPSTITAK